MLRAQLRGNERTFHWPSRILMCSGRLSRAAYISSTARYSYPCLDSKYIVAPVFFFFFFLYRFPGRSALWIVQRRVLLLKRVEARCHCNSRSSPSGCPTCKAPWGQFLVLKLDVTLDTGFVDGLGDNTPAISEHPTREETTGGLLPFLASFKGVGFCIEWQWSGCSWKYGSSKVYYTIKECYTVNPHIPHAPPPSYPS